MTLSIGNEQNSPSFKAVFKLSDTRLKSDSSLFLNLVQALNQSGQRRRVLLVDQQYILSSSKDSDKFVRTLLKDKAVQYKENNSLSKGAIVSFIATGHALARQIAFDFTTYRMVDSTMLTRFQAWNYHVVSTLAKLF